VDSHTLHLLSIGPAEIRKIRKAISQLTKCGFNFAQAAEIVIESHATKTREMKEQRRENSRSFSR